MNCPFCSHSKTAVINSRRTKGGMEVWRRRQCLKCNEIISTYEALSLDYLSIVKRNGKVVAYSRPKLFSSIYNAAIKAKKIDATEMAISSETATSLIERKLIKKNKKEIPSNELLEVVLDVLKNHDYGIYLRYICYFKYTNNSEFLKNLKKFI